MAVTIKDVAALAGVSPSTVSRTCKNNPSISEETKERVRRAMAELGYEPNFQASNLAAQISRSIGIILPPSPKETYENSFYLETIRGISHYCNAHQYISTIVTGQNEEEILNAVRSMSRSGKVDGFIVLYSRVNDPVIDFLFSEGLLYILIGKPAQYISIMTTFWPDRRQRSIFMLWATGRSLIWVSIIPWSFPQTAKQVIWQLF